MEKKYIERLFDKEREFYLRSAGAIQIVGPKRCGKSRTARRYAKTTIDLMKKTSEINLFQLQNNHQIHY